MKQDHKDPAPPIDEALLARARAGDRDALTELYNSTSLELYRTIHALVRDEELVLDIQQDTYLQAFSHLDQLREAEAFLPWLRQIAVNEARAQLRKKRPLLFSELSDDPEAGVPELPDQRPEGSPELALDREENARLVREILGGLSDSQQLLVGMYYYEQIPIAEIAEKLELRPGTVKAQLFRSRKKIEAAVRDLEKQGVKLYGLSPLPFLLALLKRQEPAAEAGKAVLEGSLSRTGAAAQTAAVQVGRRFFQTALGRVCLGLLSAAVLGGGLMGYRWAKEQLRIGDYQPPTIVETPEDLTTEPSAPSEAPQIESPEDLPTEPVPTEPTTTAPTPTDPDPTDPDPTDPVVAADLSGHPEDPTDPTPSGGQSPVSSEAPSDSSVPTAPIDPIGDPPDPFSQPTETSPTEPVVLNPRIVSCSWGASDDLYDQPWGSVKYLEVVTEDGAVPTVYTDNGAVVSLKSEAYTLSATNDRQRIYHWEVSFLGPGTARVYCAYNGVTAKVFSVTNPDHPDEILSVRINETEAPTQLTLSNGQAAWLYVAVQGKQLPEPSCDHPEILKLQNRQTLHDGNNAWYRTLYGWPLQASAAGTAQITLTFNGKTVRTITVTVIE